MAILAQAGPAKLAQLHAEGNDPTQTEAAREKQGKHALENYWANAEWNLQHAGQAIDVYFGRDILPGLQVIPLRTIMRETGLSLRYCSQIRQGEKAPRQWQWSGPIQLLAAFSDHES